jgi:hypothetical protein
MAYKRKTTDLWVVQQYTGRQYGWEDVMAEEQRSEGKARLREYRENQPEYAHRMVKKRERVEP